MQKNSQKTWAEDISSNMLLLSKCKMHYLDLTVWTGNS